MFVFMGARARGAVLVRPSDICCACVLFSTHLLFDDISCHPPPCVCDVRLFLDVHNLLPAVWTLSDRT